MRDGGRDSPQRSPTQTLLPSGSMATALVEPHIRPAPRHAGAFSTLPLPHDPAFDEADVSDKPPEVRRLHTFRPAVDERILRGRHDRRQVQFLAGFEH